MNQISNKEISIDHSFQETGINSFLGNVLQFNKYNSPTPIQYYSIKTAIENSSKSIVCRSKSGTGKTLSYITLILQSLSNLQKLQDKTYTIVIVPTRELAIQVYQNIKIILNNIKDVRERNQQQKNVKDRIKDVQVMLGIGGLDFQEDCKKYREKHAHIVVGSVGRLWELMRNRVLVIGGKMSLVLDEGDKLFGSKDEKFRQILEMLPRESRWIVFSATYSRNVLEELVRNKKFIYIQTMLKNNELEVIINNEMEQQLKKNDRLGNNQQLLVEQIIENIHLQNIKKYRVKLQQSTNLSIFDLKIKKLQSILLELDYKKCLLFVQKKSFLQPISQNLVNIQHVLIHGSLSQAARFRMMNRINQSKLIISSDLLSRGIDIKLDLVILFDAKKTDTFWHRIGRTGRYGRMGVVISLDEIVDDEWNPYEKNQINGILRGIEMEEKKVWFGGHLAEVGKWREVDEEKEMSNNYRYFEEVREQKIIKQLTKFEEGVDENKQIEIRLQQITNRNKLKQFILQNIIKCRQCKQFIKQITQLTGYKFQILQFIKDN